MELLINKEYAVQVKQKRWYNNNNKNNDNGNNSMIMIKTIAMMIIIMKITLVILVVIINSLFLPGHLITWSLDPSPRTRMKQYLMLSGN